MEKEFNTLTRGKAHTSPRHVTDVQSLETSYRNAKLHESIPGRKLRSSKDKAKDLVTHGAVKLHSKRTIQRWSENWAFERSKEEAWGVLSENDSDE